MKREFFALSVIFVVLVVFPATLFGYQGWRTRAAGVPVVDIVARAPGQGGFVPDRLSLKAGETVRLRISSPDVVHGLTIPGLGVEIAEIYPGKVVEVDLTPATPGRYAFACTRWCGVDHWRMRGVIEVTGEGLTMQPTAVAPLFQQLGIDIDAPRHETHIPLPDRPSATRGSALGAALSSDLANPARRRLLSPADAFQALRAAPETAALSDDAVWDLVAWSWLRDLRPEAQDRAAALYARDCAACHGPEGKGDGPAGVDLPGMAKMDAATAAGPADFTDAAHMLTVSDVVLQGKLLRGGMGTGMPEFGSLYTDAELWDMIAYLRTFLFR